MTFTVPNPTTSSTQQSEAPQSAPLNIEEAIQEALTQARSACATEGATSSDCAVAWDIVEELQAERSHQQVTKEHKSSFARYCDENPEADECRIYDV